IKFPIAFLGNSREVTITGEAYFEVSKNKNKPFRVKTADQTVEVLGTHFNVNSYSDEPATVTTLAEGSVRVNLGSSSNDYSHAMTIVP
ncbi:FecR family protein, partial [Bacillus sp. SIMBA_033]